MLQWFQANLGTICISLVLTCILTLIIRHLVRQKKRHQCACGCSACPHSAICRGAGKAQSAPPRP